LKLAEPWSHEELQRRRELKVEKLKRKHISQTEDNDVDGSGNGTSNNNDNDSNNMPFRLKRQMLLAHDTEEKKEKGMLSCLYISRVFVFTFTLHRSSCCFR